MIWWEAEYRRADLLEGPEAEDTWIGIPRIQAGRRLSFEVPTAGPGRYELRARRFDDATGEASEWRYSGIVEVLPTSPAAPAPPINLRVTCHNLLWDDMTGRTDIRGYLVRSIPGDDTSWGNAVPAHEGVWPASPLPICSVPKGARTFLVRAVDVNGVEGDIASLYVTATMLGAFDDALPEEIETQAEATTFGGNKVGCSVSGGALVADTTEEFWGPDEAPFWAADAYEFWGVKGKTMEYTQTFTPAATPAADEVVTATVTTDGLGWRLEVLPGEWDGDEFWEADGEEFWGEDHEEFWPGGRALPWPGRVTNLAATALRFRLVVPGQYPVASVTALTIKRSSPTKTARGSTSVAGSPGPTSITFPTGRFAAAPQLLPHVRGAGSEFQVEASNITSTGADLRVYDAAGTEVFTGTIDWVAVGR